MDATETRRAMIAALVGGLTMVGGAAGYTAARVFTVRPGDSADFPAKNSVWSCTNTGKYVRCQGGDAYPYVQLGAGSSSCKCASLEVFTLRDPQGGHVIRTLRRRLSRLDFRSALKLFTPLRAPSA